MMDYQTSADLPLDVRSRAEGLLALVSDIRKRVSTYPILPELVDDFYEMAKHYILLFEENLRREESLRRNEDPKDAAPMPPREKWLRRHEMLDKLTHEWQLIYSLCAARELGSSSLNEFQRYVDQAIEDIGLTQDRGNFLLIPTFGENFSVVTVGYSSDHVAILNLPISVIHSPWELSVIWHELAGLKVIQIRDQIKDFLDAYARERNLAVPDSPMPRGADSDVIARLLQRIAEGASLDEDFITSVRTFLGMDAGIPQQPLKIWSQDWFEQLYEDACSVFAFGSEFVSVLEKILGRQSRKLTADRKHPDLNTRLEVARRLLRLREEDPPAAATDTECLTDELLWAFLNRSRSEPASTLPVAFADAENPPEIRGELIGHMQEFNHNFGDLAQGTITEQHFDFGAMSSFGEKASREASKQTSYSVPNANRSLRVREILLERFKDADIKSLLEKPFSPPDELDYWEHTGTDTWRTMYIGSSSHGAHYVIHTGH